jgi:hypothetical protein
VRGAGVSVRDAGSERLSAPAACACGRLRRVLVGAGGEHMRVSASTIGHRQRALDAG